jgi:hypothetical protein
MQCGYKSIIAIPDLDYSFIARTRGGANRRAKTQREQHDRCYIR